MAEHILQDHRAALERRKPHERTQTRAGNFITLIEGIRRGDHGEGLLILDHPSPRAAPQEIECCVVSDAKHPALGVVDDTNIWYRDESFDHCVLDDVFAIDGGAGHPRTVSMEPGAEFAQQAFELVARRTALWGCP